MQLIEYSDLEIPSYIDGVIDRFSNAITQTDVAKSQARRIAETKIIGEFFPERKRNNKQLVYHIHDDITKSNIGWLWLADRGDHELRVADIFIVPMARGKGHGSEAMTKAEAIAKDKSCSVMSLHVFDKNIKAKSLYLRLGYKIVSSISGKYEMHKAL